LQEEGVDKAFHVMARAAGHLPGAALEWEAVEAVAYPAGRSTALNVGRATHADSTRCYRYDGCDVQELVEASGTRPPSKPFFRGPPAAPRVTAHQLLAHAEGKSLAEHTMQRHVLKRIVVL
jgi:hypothetical protein